MLRQLHHQFGEILAPCQRRIDSNRVLVFHELYIQSDFYTLPCLY